MPFIRSLSSLSRGDLALAGGKGANLGAMLAGGLPVPDGFCLTTEAYRAFVADNQLGAVLDAAVATARLEAPDSLEAASHRVWTAFVSGRRSEALERELLDAYRGLGRPPVAVRSSATAEDLPELSFAGQQDTSLNVIGEAALLDAVVRCWASLWTARAIGYRLRNRVDAAELALAVVVQRMVDSQASGVMFTANPLTGARGEVVIDATRGLGEALVSGQVEPDHYVVDRQGRLVERRLGAKALVVKPSGRGGTAVAPGPTTGEPALPDDAVAALATLGRRAEALFGGPQDVEWAWADGRLHLVQSRPVTSLYPLPAGASVEPLELYLSFAVWQGMLDPYTPLGQDLWACAVTGFARAFGYRVEPSAQRALVAAGERLFVNLTPLWGSRLGRRLLDVFLASVDPVSHAILRALDGARPSPPGRRLSLRTLWHLARGVGPVVSRVLAFLLSPAKNRRRLDGKIDEALALARRRYAEAKDLGELARRIRDTTRELPRRMFAWLLPGVVAGQVPLQVLSRKTGEVPGAGPLVLELTRGLPHNVTTEMDLALWQAAQAIGADPTARAHVLERSVEALLVAYRAGALPPTAQREVAAFLGRYGLRGPGEIDAGRARWSDEPAPVLQLIQGYLTCDAGRAPPVVFQRGAARASEAARELAEACRRTPGRSGTAQLVELAVPRLRELGGLRETPKFFVVRLFGEARAALLRMAEPLVAAGRLERADDVFFVGLEALEALGRGDDGDWKGLASSRRAAFERERRRRRLPRVMLSDGCAFFDAPTSSEAPSSRRVTGSPVSPGRVEGVVRVLREPSGGGLLSGEILVCPATDPVWTPLFLTAGGLVMEVGGMMTHGSVVAREYGIPAVVGVPDATVRFHSGQRVRVDGTQGTVEVLDDAPGGS